MLKIRLQRTGRINMPSYRVIVTEHTRGPKTGNFVEKVGSYNPKSKERTLNEERITYWISKGAQPSGTMHNMLISAGIIKGKKINVLPKKTVAKVDEPVVEAAPAAAAVAETVAETAPLEEAVELEEAKEEEITESAPIPTEDSVEEKVANE
ncbi:30S ribosomal protein S16 [Candidatus Kaiserbacteria bacterium]|nr:30S ribosomal protein S16 [Candidatus Kaiserbacteria bacterium]